MRSTSATPLLLRQVCLAVLLVCLVASESRGDRAAPRQRSHAGAARVGTWVAPPVDEAALIAENEVDRRAGRRPLRVAARIEAGLRPADAGRWEDLPDGSRRWRLTVRSAGARWISLAFDEFRLPRGAALRIRDPEGGRRLGPFTVEDERPDGKLWLPPIAGDSAVVELDWPAALRPVQPALQLASVSHGFRAPGGSGDGEPLVAAGSCHIDINCPLGDDWQGPKRGVVRLHIAGEYFCTGSLINNTGLDCTPYVLTAEHCFDATHTPADTVFLFNYELPACSEPGTVPVDQWLSGSTLRFGHQPSDHRLLELDSSPPASWNLFFNGWSASTLPAGESWTIHHPEGDFKKITHDADALVDGIDQGPDHWRVNDWEEGSTDAGSSGGPLFDPDRRIVGELHVDTASCANPNGFAEFGKFDVAWSSGLSVWLDPGSSGATVLDGMDQGFCGAPAPRLSHAGQVVDDSLGFTNGHADPGESFLLEIQLLNDGPLTATAVGGTLSTTDPLVTVTDSSATWADIAPFRTVSSDGPHFAVDVDPGFVCGDSIPFQLSLSSGQGAFQSDFLLPTGLATGLQQPPPFEDDMESGTNGWTVQNLIGATPWQQVTDQSNSPTHSWHVPDMPGIRDSVLLMPTLVSVPPRATLRFAHLLDSESGDGGVLEYSTDGFTWHDAGDRITTGRYNSVIPTGFSSPIAGRLAWAGDLGGWRTVVVDLTPLEGQTLTLRWRFASDSFSGGVGWYVDDVVLDTPTFQCVTCTDLDNDGFCPAPDGDDCDDGDPDVHPGAAQLCDGLNNDCDDPLWPGLPANETDGDADGLSSCAGDCNGADPGVRPGAAELCDGQDNDCDGLVDNDVACDTSCDASEAAGDELWVDADPSTSTQPALVWNGAGYGVVWADARDGNLELYFSRLDALGRVVVGAVRLTDAPFDALNPSLVWNGEDYAVAWCDKRSNPPDAYFARLDDGGSVLGGEVLLGSCRGTGNNSLAWNGFEYAMVWVDADSEVSLARVDASGVPAGAPTRLSDGSGSARAPFVIWNGSEYAVAWHGKDGADQNQVFFTRVDAGGDEVGNEQAVTVTSAASRWASLAWTGAEHAVAYNEGTGDSRLVLLLRLDASGDPLGGPTQLSDGATAGSQRPSVAWSGGEYGVIWRDVRDGNGEVYFARVDAGGSEIGTEMRLTESSADSLSGELVWTGSQYGLVWSESLDVLFRRLGCNCFDADGDGWSSCNDNCGEVFNPSQSDLDDDLEGDHCDLDDGMVYLLLPSSTQVDWQAEQGFDSWNLYRGDLDELPPLYTQLPGSNDLADRQCGLSLAPTSAADGATPDPGKTAFFLVSGVSGASEGGLGHDSSGTPRSNANPCPPAP